jgi:hypothetical protein
MLHVHAHGMQCRHVAILHKQLKLSSCHLFCIFKCFNRRLSAD